MADYISGEIVVSIIVCTRNEEKHIRECLVSLINQKNVNGAFEILVIDGMSEDNTVSIIKEFEKRYRCIRYFENKAIVKPPAVNLGFRESRGNFVAICDAHTLYDLEYISNLLKLMELHPEAQCVGGPIVSLGDNNFGKATAVAMSAVWGVGNVKHRFPEYEGYAEMACFPLFRREVFNMIGYYDERFIINHDDEYCFRLNKAGGKVYLSPIAKSYYYVRNTPSKLFRQYFSYGFWQIATLKKYRTPISMRQLIPAAFFSTIFLLGIISWFTIGWWFAFILPLFYFMVLGTIAVINISKYGLSMAKYIPISTFILHFSYAAGFIWGVIKFNFGREKFTRDFSI